MSLEWQSSCCCAGGVGGGADCDADGVALEATIAIIINNILYHVHYAGIPHAYSDAHHELELDIVFIRHRPISEIITDGSRETILPTAATTYILSLHFVKIQWCNKNIPR